MMANDFASGFGFGKGVVDDSVLQQRTSRLSELASQAYGAQGPQRDALVQQAVRIDPSSGMALGDKLQGREDDRKGRMAGAAKYLLSAFERGDQAAIQGAYRTVRPEFEALSNGAQLPDQVDDTILPMLHQVIAAAGGTGGAGNSVQSRFVADDGRVMMVMRDGAVVDSGEKADRQMWFRDHPGMAPQLVGKDGQVQTVGQSAQQQQMAPGEVPFTIDPSLPPQVQAAIRANPDAGSAQGIASLQVQPQQSIARPSEAQTAAQTEAAKLAAQLAYLPQKQAIETQGAIAKERGVGEVKLDLDREQAAPKKLAGYRAALEAAGNVRTSIEKSLEMIGPMSTGFLGARSRGIEGTPAYNLAAEIETIKANLGFDRIQQMRDNSPTGGALGQVAIQELVALQSTVANLDPNQSAEQLADNIGRIEQHYTRWEEAVKQAAQQEQTFVQNGQQQAAQPGGWGIQRVD